MSSKRRPNSETDLLGAPTCLIHRRMEMENAIEDLQKGLSFAWGYLWVY
jgi:hypothetical protein